MIHAFPACAVASAILWLAGIFLRRAGHRRAGDSVYFCGLLVLAGYVAALWLALGRPPMRTLGETRLLYALLLPAVALGVSLRWRIAWPMIYGAAVAAVFLGINVLRPDAFDKTLMPALQSAWFVPHVVVYILAYAFLTASALGAARFLLGNEDTLPACDRAVWIGLAFLTMGLLFGAFWAKEAWGHYWTWDPKETWAFLTWAIYLAHIHIRLHHSAARQFAAVFLVAAVAVLAVCWFGVNYLPSAASSVHTYAQE
jgi:ABC-type transport system involved in cytochrome c biogenesis permease subunit